MDQDEARAALEAMQGAKDRLADVYAEFPAWRHAALSLLFGVLVLSAAAPRSAYPFVLLPAALFALWLIRNERKTYGIDVRGGQRTGSWLYVAIVTLGAFGLVYLARSTRSEPFPSLQSLGVAAIAALFGLTMSVIRRRLYRARLSRRDQA